MMRSYAVTSKYDGPRLALLRAHKPHHQLDIRRCVGLPPETQSSVLYAVRPRVRRPPHLVSDATKHINRYTSLGSTFNTFPNPALLIDSPQSLALPLPDSPGSFISPGTALTSIMSSTHVVTPTAVLSSYITSPHVPNGHTHENMPRTPDVDVDVDLWKASLPEPKYRPAYELLDGNLERCGRGLSMPTMNGVHKGA
jgi:hypothetical protein